MPRTTFGPQPYSHRKTEPSYGFGGATREQFTKLFVSQEVSKAAPTKDTPGHIYELAPAVGAKQADARKPDLPKWKFGTSSRFPKPSAKDIAGNDYNLPASLGKRPSAGQLSHVRSEPLFTFGTSTREQNAKAMTEVPGKESPGPAVYTQQGSMGRIANSRFGSQPNFSMASRSYAPDGSKALEGGVQYALPQSVGTQVDSRKAAAPMPKFGTSLRPAPGGATLSPGPHADYHLSDAVGKQVSSRNRTGGTASFSRSARFADRFAAAKNAGPGPGAYEF